MNIGGIALGAGIMAGIQNDEINRAREETKETLKALMADMERIEPNTEDGENIKRTCICMVLEYMEGEE